MHEDSLIVHLTIDGELIETTPEHPFRLANGDWVPAAALEIGSPIQRANSTTGIAAAIEFSFTPFSDEAQPPIRGQSPLQLAGYDIASLPMTQLCRGWALNLPLDFAQQGVPNMLRSR